MMITGVIETFAICRLYRFHWPWFSLWSSGSNHKKIKKLRMLHDYSYLLKLLC